MGRRQIAQSPSFRDPRSRTSFGLPAAMAWMTSARAGAISEINEEKSRIVDLSRGESFGFLGFDFRRVGDVA